MASDLTENATNYVPYYITNMSYEMIIALQRDLNW